MWSSDQYIICLHPEVEFQRFYISFYGKLGNWGTIYSLQVQIGAVHLPAVVNYMARRH